MFGTGLLTLPYAAKQAGVGVALAGFLFLGLWNFYTCRLIAVCAEAVVQMRAGRRQGINYDVLCAMTLGQVGKWVGIFNVLFHQIGVCAAYAIFFGKNISAVTDVGETTIYWLLFPPFAASCLLRDTSSLSLVSLSGNLVLGMAIASVLYYAYTTGTFNEPAMSTDSAGFALFYGLAVFAFSGQTEVCAIYLSMRDRTEYQSAVGAIRSGTIRRSFVGGLAEGAVGGSLGGHAQPKTAYSW
jgi:amino acid permease